MNRSKAKGTFAESAVAYYLSTNGYPQAEARRLHGALDKGDIVNGPPGYAIEVKAHRTPNYAAWLREAETERINAGCDYGVVIHKPHGVGVTNVGRWHVVMTFDTWLETLRIHRPLLDDE